MGIDIKKMRREARRDLRKWNRKTSREIIKTGRKLDFDYPGALDIADDIVSGLDSFVDCIVDILR